MNNVELAGLVAAMEKVANVLKGTSVEGLPSAPVATSLLGGKSSGGKSKTHVAAPAMEKTKGRKISYPDKTQAHKNVNVSSHMATQVRARPEHLRTMTSSRGATRVIKGMAEKAKAMASAKPKASPKPSGGGLSGDKLKAALSKAKAEPGGKLHRLLQQRAKLKAKG